MCHATDPQGTATQNFPNVQRPNAAPMAVGWYLHRSRVAGEASSTSRTIQRPDGERYLAHPRPVTPWRRQSQPYICLRDGLHLPQRRPTATRPRLSQPDGMVTVSEQIQIREICAHSHTPQRRRVSNSGAG